jgi:hypothetical protein
VTATWEPRCGADGPRGLALDATKGWLFVACTDHVLVMDAARGGAQLSQVAAGEGVDNIDYLDGRGLIYIAAGKAATLTVARVDEKGVASVVAAADGTAYVADGKQARIVAFALAP